MMDIQEQYIKNELNHLKSEEVRAKDEVSHSLRINQKEFTMLQSF